MMIGEFGQKINVKVLGFFEFSGGKIALIPDTKLQGGYSVRWHIFDKKLRAVGNIKKLHYDNICLRAGLEEEMTYFNRCNVRRGHASEEYTIKCAHLLTGETIYPAVYDFEPEKLKLFTPCEEGQEKEYTAILEERIKKMKSLDSDIIGIFEMFNKKYAPIIIHEDCSLEVLSMYGMASYSGETHPLLDELKDLNFMKFNKSLKWPNNDLRIKAVHYVNRTVAVKYCKKIGLEAYLNKLLNNACVEKSA